MSRVNKKTTVPTGKKTGQRISAKKAASYLHSMQNIKTTNIIEEPKWNPKHFRLFVGNLGPDVTNDLLNQSFNKYETLSAYYVPIDKKTQKNKGFGFVAFESSEDYLKAFKEMNGKYIGQYPIQLKRAESKVPKIKK
ncbi:unnamed protein product [Candida verbasci]|uniref:RRM domain-containing protein n=1 Tax=Candida verbasci TaxID=1227364 RepID=A0A9W4TV07_9ASCO|nr:unnamed protein product [Candida verbasci]